MSTNQQFTWCVQWEVNIEAILGNLSLLTNALLYNLYVWLLELDGYHLFPVSSPWEVSFLIYELPVTVQS